MWKVLPVTQKPDQCLGEWIDREALAEAMIPLIGQLYRNNNVVTSIYGRGLINRSVIAILKAHRFARHRLADDAELSVHETFPILKAMSELKLGAASVDLGKMVAKFKAEGNGRSIEDFVKAELAEVVGKQNGDAREGTDVVLYGFGRIGRLLARILIEKTGGGDGLRLRAIVVRKGAENDLVKRASLLRRDSVHGPFDGTITIDEENNTLTANGNLIQVIYSNDPASIDYTQYGIKNALLVDNTGKWRDAEGLGQHLKCPGIDRVILTAPGKGALKNIVHGINHGDIGADDKIISAASCTTNAIVPVLKAVNDQYGIVNGHVETVHSFTNDQNLIDNFHKGSRRGRSCAAEHGDHRDRCRHRRRQGPAGAEGQADRQRHPRADAERVHGDPQPEPGKGHHPRRDQRVPAPDGHALGPAEADRLRQLPGSGFHRLRRLAPCRRGGRRGDHRQRQPRRPVRVVRQRVRLQLPGRPRDGRHGWREPAGLPALIRKA